METLIKKLIKENIHLSVKGSDLEIHFNGDVLPTDLIQELKKNKQELIHYIQTKESKKVEEGTIIKNYREEYRESGKPVPLSFAQERMWFVDQLAGTLPYHNPTAYSVFGNIYPPLFEQAFRALVDRHEVLHTVVKAVDGHPQQVLFPSEEWTMNYYDEINFENDDEIKAFLQKEIQRPFDLSQDSPLRVSMIKTEAKHHILLMVNHHIATDDWSSEIMMKEFQLLFNALSQGADPQLPQLPIQYADFAIWQRLEFGEEGLVKQQKFWKEHLNEATDFEFPTDFPRPVHKSSRGARGDIQTTPELAQQINQLGKQEGATAFMLMLAAFKTLFYKYTQQEDICLGAPIAGRTIKEVEPLIGFFVNTLPMRSQIDPQQSFRSYLGEVKKTTLNAYANQQVPFEQIVEVAGANRALDRDPLFQITLTSLGPQGVGGEEAGPAIDPSDIPEGAVQIVPYSNDLNLMAQRDMSLYFVEKAGRYLLGTFYCADLYEQVTIDRMLEHFINLLSSIVENPDGKIADLNILSGKEKKQLLLEFNKTNAPYPQDQSIADLFEAQVQKTPQHTALRFGDKSWTYQELNEEAESLAKHLQSQYQVKPGDFVGLMMSRSEWMIISILGILKAGAAYVPIDPSLPGERKNFIIEDTKLKLMIILSESLFDMNLMEVDSLAIDIQLDMIKESESSTVLDRQSTAKDPAYVMYTSGTTGKPKGIVVNQVNVIKLSKEAKEIAVFESDRVLQWSNYAFDGSVYEIFSSLLNGASLHMIANQDAADPNRLAKVLREQDISILFITTALFNAFVDVELAALKGLRKILFGGELVSPLHVQRALAELGPDSIIHVYGPTETTVYATYYPVREAKDLNVPIGRPLSNTKIYLVTESGHLAGIGVQGEIWIGGDGVAQRYLNRPELTAEKFIDNPFTHTKDARIYKTGDLAKMLPDGNIEFIGRKDSQIKMRGYRIELGEIETVLQKLDQVQQAVVLAKKDPSGTKQLVAYVVPANGQFDKAQIQNELKTHLPEYMVPAMMMEIEKMPLNANGKIDKRALPEPDTSNIASKEYVAPTSETEQKIAKIWQELLEVEQVGINDDFFELGGHSLLATRVISELRTQLNIEVAIRDMFQHTNVKDLAIFIDQQAPESDLPKIKIQPRPERIPLSYAQERLWFVDRLQGSVQYHIPMILKVSGDLNLELFEYGFKEVIDRHELLRTVIKEENGVSYQEIIDSDNWSMDLIQDPKYFDRKVLDPLINELVGRPFNLSEEYPIRVHMIQLNEAGEYLFIANLHHIATDGWSNSIMVDEFVQFYTAMEKGEKAALPPLPIQFADYAIWERQTHDKSALEKQLDFWMEQLNGVSQLDLPTDYPRPALQSFRGGTEAMAFSKELSDQIVDFANQYDVTPFMVFLAAFKNLLYKYSGQEDICIGSPIAGRTIKEVESLIGFFVNTLTLRSQIDPEMSFLDLLSTVKGTLLDAYANQLVPFEQIVERLGVERDLSRTPIFSITLSYQNTPDTKEKSLGNIRFEGMDSDNLEITTQRDLSVFVEESPHGFIVAMNYCIDLYKGSTITQMMEHFSMLLSAIIKDPEQKIGHLSMTTPEERNQLLLGFNDTALPYPGDQSIIDLFEAQVAKTPEHTALVCKGQSWTYQELNKKANILAQLLKEEFELGKGDFVGIMMPRSEWMIIALLGILKTEAAYVPLDLSHPSDRKAFVAEDTDLKALILLSENIFDVTTLDVPGLAIDIQFSEFEEQFPDEAPEREGGSQHPAYVMYTSGTTGKPKGIVVRQQNVVKLAKESNEIAIFDHDRVLQWSNFAFDGSVYEIFASLLSGASLHLIPGQDASDPIQLAKHIKEQELTVAFITTALFNALVDFEASSLQPLRKILFGGEMVSTQHVAKALEVLGTEKVIHVYGPTETTVYASYHPIQSCEGNTVPIGKPLSNTQIYIVDKNGDHAGIGVVGEVWIGGDGVASGYLNRPKLTADKFIDNPFAPHSGSIYKTGDLARFLPDGNIEFIGRRDSQIKMRGYRIELGEIEAALNQNPAVQQAHVSAQKDPSGTKQLVAYIVAQGDFNPDTLKSTLKTKLPEYMVPAIMVELEALPLTPNGKVDKKALPAPDVANMSQKEYVAPRNEIEAKVAAIWKVLLELTEDISIHHDFFELGGHSLLATRVISEVRDQFNVELAIKDLFQATTVAQLAQLIEEKEQAIVLPKLVVQDRPERIPLSYAQERLWFIDQVEGSLHYHIPNLFKIQGTFNQTAFEKAFQTIVNRHELLRTVIKEEQGLAYQEILPINQWSMQVNSAHEGLSKEQVTALVDEVIIRPFDLAQDHPLRVEVIKVKEDEHIMVMIMHHIASDGWSSGIFLDEFNALYNAYEKGEELTLDPLDIQYADFAIWQRKYHSGALLKQQIDYWKEQLQHNTPLSIPLDFPRPAMQSFRGANSGVFINRELTDRLNDLANQKEVTPFMLLLAAFKALLYRYGRQGDISVGTPVAGRTTKEVESLIGFFVNTLVIRSQVEAELPFDQYLETIKQTTLNAFANQMAPFEKIVEALDIERDPSRNPIFQVMFAYQNAPSGDETPESDLRISPANTTSVNLAQRDISITISEMPQGLIIGMNYCADLFLQSTMDQMMLHYSQLLQAIVAQPDLPIGQLNLLSEKEKATLLGFNTTATDYPKTKTITELFKEQVQLSPDQSAVVFGEQSWTYQQLDQASDELAVHLQKELAVQPGDFVGLLVERSPWMVLGILGTIKAGAAYVPISIDHPQERKQFILQDTDIQVVLTTSFAQEQSEALEVSTWVMDRQITSTSTTDPVLLPTVTPQAPAYVIYTSGTTGQPKGTLVSHQNLINLVKAHETLAFQNTDRIVQWPSYTFDVSAFDFFNTLLNGASLYLISEKVYNDPALLSSFIKEQQISAISFATAFFNAVVDHDVNAFKNMRRIMIGGEKASLSHTQRAAKVAGPNVIINAYGPTEATVITSYFPVVTPDFHQLPIGRPISNVKMYIVDQFEQLAGIGVAGELWIGGDAVSLGYHDRPELNAQKFVADPFSDDPAARIYKTGDLARYLPDGNIDFIGRMDAQVKIRGYRVELGEIEHLLQAHPYVRQAVVLTKKDLSQNNQIIAYIVEEQEFDQAAIQTFLQQLLPAYMLPAAYVLIDEVPLTLNGKVNQNLLPPPDFMSLKQQAYLAPRNELEQQIVDIWLGLLKVEQIGVNDDFFELGGHSLLATRAIAQLKSLKAIELNVRDLFQFPTTTQLAHFIEGQQELQQIPGLVPQERATHIPLSFAQERLWFVHNLGGSQQYHTPTILTLRGDVDAQLLMQAFKAVVQRHEVLRTLIKEQNGKASQIITSGEDWSVELIEKAPFQNTTEQQAYLEAFTFKAFDFGQDYPIRVQLIQTGEEQYLLAMVVHHIASDGWSASILIDEVWSIYQSLKAESEINLPVLDVQYADYAIWQRKHHDEEAIQKQLNYWKGQLREVTPLELPTDLPRPAIQSIRGGTLATQLNKEVTQQLLSLAQSQQVTPFMLIMAACKVLLYRYSNQQDICIGTPVAGRTTKASEQLIGCFINTLAIRSKVEADMTFEQLLQNVKQTTLDAFANQLVPFEQIVEVLGAARDMSRSPIHQVSLSYQNVPDAQEVPEASIQMDDSLAAELPITTQRDLSIFAKELPDGLVLAINYCIDLFTEQSIEQMLKHLHLILQSVLESPQTPVAQLAMIDQGEKTLLLQEFNPTAVAYPSDQNIIHLFEQQVEQSPEQIALIFADQQWSYQALNQQANHLAQYLRQQYQVGQGDFVAMLLPRSEWAIVATLAILKTGATYVPIDLKYPQERKQHILEDTQAKVVLTLSSQLAEVMDLDATLCSVDIEIDNFEQENSPANPNFAQKGGQHLAYAMYTSGSMGQPKGVLIPHRAIARLIFNPDFAFLGPSTRIYQYAPLAFDAATFEIWGTLLKGGTLIVPEDGLKTVEAIAQDLQQHQVNTLWLTAGLFHQVVDYHLPLFEGLEYLLSGGDSLHIPAIQKVRTAYPELVFINGYGPTESTTFATIHRLNAGENPDPNLNLIGRPIGNTQVFILNPDSDILTPRGISGELCIGGDGLADAYLNLPELTQAKFIEHPFREGQRLYRTGDLGKFLADGNIVFMGRVDDQVKVRGYRIELGEIENALQATEQVKQATVVTQNDSTGNKQVVAYIVPQANFDATAIRSALKHQLPEYMIPTFMVEMDALPLTNNGKVDRAALPVPDISSLSEVDFVAPRNETEAAIAQIWQDLLEVEQVGIHHDFFTLGGHSLLATRVISEIREQFQVEIAIREIFEFTTVEQLAQLIDQKEQQHSLPKLVAQERPERIPLSYAQERLWFIDRLQGSTQYNIPILLKISGEVRFDIFQQSFNALLQRHELLRTVLKEDDGQLYQSIQSAEQWQMELIEEEQYFDQQNLADLVNQLVFSPFQLSEEFPIRVHLIKMNETGDFLFIINLHHIATDGWSNSILVDELIQHYRAFEKGQVPDFAPLKVQYADYAIWQKTHFDKAVIGQQMEYWTTQLADVVPLNLLTDFPRPAMRSIRGGQRSILLDAKLSEKILQIANEKEATPFMFFLTALNTLLFRYTGQQDFCVGSPIAGRTVKEVESMIGFFINNLVLRAQLAKDMSFDDLFEQVKNTTLDAYANQMVSFEQIVEALGVQRDLTQDPLYQVTLSYQNMPENKERGFDNITFDENYQLEELEILAQRDLSVFVLETPEGYALSINYCIDLFKDETIEGMLLHFNQLLVSIVERSDLAIGQLEMIHAEEQRLLIEQYNQTEADYPKTQSIAQLFAAQAAIHPDKVALVFGDQQWTYQEIDERANQLAKYLIEKHEVQKGDFVGILMNRSEWMILSMLATLKAGAAYVPIDPTYPSERKAFMIEDTEVKALLILSEQLFEVSTLEVPTIALDIQTDQLEAFDGVKPVKVEGSIEDNAYVMYTSGTTGQPKGILVNQRNVIKLAFEQKAIAINADDKVLQWSNFAFDGSTYEIYASLLNGASLHLIPNKDAADAVLLARHIRQHELTVAFITTALFNAFVDVELAALQGLRKLLFGGELVSTHHVKKALAVLGPDKIVHVYGPTETTVYATYHPVATCKGNTLPIGQALSNTQVYIVDEQGQIAGTNVLGEIWIGGDGVANGYLNRPKLTAEKFVDNPFGKGRIYKTGDLARILPDGNIEFIGRQDTQIKMRGYRIELGEIESNLKASDQVQQAVVIAQEDASGTQQLVAYIVPQGDFDQEAIEQSLKNKLPTYMIPAIMVALETLPLTANGKVDKKALPQANVTDRSTTEFVAPRTETEIKIANIWKDLLHLESVGIHHDFFDLGGHSLLATRVVSEIRDQFNVELAIRDLFQATTVAQLAQLVEAQEQQSALPKLVVQERPQRIPLSYAQERLWFIDQLEGSLHYHISRIIKIDGEFNTLAFEKALQAIVNRHELLRTVIKEDQGIAYQEVLPSNQWSMQWDLEHDQLSVEQVTALVDKIITRPFDLSQEHPLRVEVIKVSKDEHIMVMIMHHIASDAWSFGVFLDEFNALYSAYEKGEELSLDPLPIQYADFAIWQRKYHDGVLLDQQLDYWQQQLQNNTPLSIPTDFPRPALQSFRGANSGIFVNKELTDQLNALASQQEVTPFMLLLTAFKTLLYRYSGQGDLSVGTPIAGRTVKEVESLIGFFVNTLVIRSQVEATTPFDQYLEIIKQTTLDAFANQMAPFEKIVETLGVERDPSRSPIFQVMFAYQNAPTASGDQQEASSLKVSYTDTTTVIQAQRDISISIEETPDGLLIGANYCADLYLPATMERMMEHYLYLLQAIVAAPKQPIGQLNMLSEQEQQTLLGFNHLTTDYPKEQTIIELFEEQVRLHQDQTALVFEEQSWTYQELDQASDQLAMRLQRDFNVQPGDFVGLLVERSPWMIIGIMGILKVGAAYVPISIDHPLERKQFIVSDTQIRVLLTTNFAQAHCTELAVDTWAMDQQEQTPKSDTPVELPVFDSQTPAYMIYTSGTTGLPKGTLVSHQNLINLIRADENLVYQSTDRVLQWPSYTFDISAYDIFGALLNGAALYLIGENVYNDPALLAQLIQAQQISATSLATAFFNTLVDHDVMIFKGMRRVLMGGEKASLSHTRKFVEAIGPNVLINAYGPTEATILTAYYPVQSVNFDRLPIGSPIANVNMYIVNAFEQLAGIGVIGELWIGGDAVSLGYHQRPELTAEKFVSDPFHPAADARVYKTGDLARYLPDGNIEFIGRIDTQVKVRGYRIELSEIEYAIQEHNSVRQSIVLAKEDTNGLAQIIAYIVGTADFDQATLQQAIQSKLPAYMLPAAYVRIDEVPLNVQGKVDQARLPKPDFLEGSQVAYVAARNELEQQIIDIWSDLLEVDQIGVHHSFFELGGHSLLATRAIAQIKSLRAVELNVRDLFQHPTVAQLAEFVERQSGIQQIPELTPQERGAMIPLSFAQERLWFVHQLSGSQQYHTPNILTLRPDTDPVLLMQAFKEVVQRHEVLRTLIREQNGQAYQIVTSAEDWQVTFMEQTPFQNEEEQQTHFEQFVSEAFDFSQEYPLRVQLIQVGDEGYILAMVVHHIASDGWSASILIDEVWNIYQALSNGKQANLPLLDVQYADYAIWQRKYYGEATIQQQLDYWKIQLNELTTLELPTDFPRPAVQSIRGANLAVQLSPTTTQQLLALAQSCQVTPFMLVMAACKVLLYRYSNQQDICIGTPIAGRTTKATEQLIGCFINTLAIRSQVDSDMTFEQLLAQVKQTTLDAFANQLVPFEQIVDALGTERDMSRSPIYQVSLSYQNTPDAEGMPGGEEAPEGTTGMTLPVTTQRDLSIFAKEFPDGLVLTMNYCVDLFAAHTVEQMLKHLQMILQSIVESPKASVAALGMIDREERTLLLQEWNDTAFDYPDDQSIAHLFEQQVEQTPEQTALVFGTKLWSYQELNTQANRLAHYLQQQHQVGQGDFVAMLVPRSEWAIVAILGILKTGAAYVPIDLKYPQERKQHILNDTQAKVVLTLSDQLAEVMELDATLCTLDMELSAFEQEGSASNPDFAQQGGQHLAYAMYTSGSTGLPKGVLIPHRAIARLIFSADFAFLGQETRMYQYAPLAFDASTFEIWGSLLKGGTLIVPDDELKTVKAIAEDLQQYSVNTLWLTAGLFHHVVENHLALFDGLDYLLSGGDSLRVPAIQKVRAAYPELVFINGYGPTESTTFATIHRLDAGENPAPNLNLIGRPISNTQIYILHPDSQVLTPRGIAGEICIGGDGLANAYLNLPQLTADKFIDHPFMAGQRLYRTGDLGKFLPDGKIAFMGRIDHQVKIRGYRIELTEIEHILMQHEGIKQAIVKTVEDANGSKFLAAYISKAVDVEMAVIQDQLKQQVPDYMLPTIWLEVEVFPLNNNGKVDRDLLPLPDLSELSTQEYVAPRNEIETTLADIWAALLKQERVGIYDNFFELGGHSLLAMQAISNMQEAFNVSINVGDLFRNPTVEMMSQVIEEQASQPIERIQPKDDADNIDRIEIEDDF